MAGRPPSNAAITKLQGMLTVRLLWGTCIQGLAWCGRGDAVYAQIA